MLQYPYESSYFDLNDTLYNQLQPFERASWAVYGLGGGLESSIWLSLQRGWVFEFSPGCFVHEGQPIGIRRPSGGIQFPMKSPMPSRNPMPTSRAFGLTMSSRSLAFVQEKGFGLGQSKQPSSSSAQEDSGLEASMIGFRKSWPLSLVRLVYQACRGF